MENGLQPAGQVVVCGGGIVGASTLYYLAQRGIPATLVEREAIACAASGKAGGLLAEDWCDGQATEQLSHVGFALHAELAATFGPTEIGYSSSVPCLSAAAGSKGRRKGAGKRGPSQEGWWLEELPNARLMGEQEKMAIVHPAKLTRALVAAAEARGAKVVRGRVEGLKLAGPAGSQRVQGVLVDGEVLPADAAVIALGPWSGQAAAWLPPGLLPAIGGHLGHSIVLRPREPMPPTAMFVQYPGAEYGGEDAEVVVRPDGTVWLCAHNEMRAALPEDPASVGPSPGVPAKLQALAAGLSSRLAEGEAEVVAEQACVRPISPDGTPLIGSIPGVSGAYIGTGHSCWGILWGPATGKALAELIAGDDPSIELSYFNPGRFGKAKKGSFRGVLHSHAAK